MSEKNAYSRFYTRVIRPGYDRVDRIENGLGAGMPDINLCLSGRESWIELKSPVEPKRATTPLFGSNHKVSRDQRNWFKRQIDAGGRAFLIIATDQRWMLIHGADVDGVNDLTVGELQTLSLWHATQTVLKGAMPWYRLRELLITEE